MRSIRRKTGRAIPVAAKETRAPGRRHRSFESPLARDAPDLEFAAESFLLGLVEAVERVFADVHVVLDSFRIVHNRRCRLRWQRDIGQMPYFSSTRASGSNDRFGTPSNLEHAHPRGAHLAGGRLQGDL